MPKWHICHSDFNPELSVLINKLHERFAARPHEFASGLTRNVFIYDRYVVKIPNSLGGLRANDWEGSISNIPERLNDPHYLEYYVQYPRTRLVVIDDFPILFMERIKPTYKPYAELPDWVGSVDCGQVGYTKQGRLVAYDYGR